MPQASCTDFWSRVAEGVCHARFNPNQSASDSDDVSMTQETCHECPFTQITCDREDEATIKYRYYQYINAAHFYIRVLSNDDFYKKCFFFIV